MTTEERSGIEREWAAHLDHCEDPYCEVCAGFDRLLYSTL